MACPQATRRHLAARVPEKMLTAGTWTTADIDYGGFVYVPASLKNPTPKKPH